MRFKLILNSEKSYSIIPLNYYYPISAWIYKKIQQAEQNYSDFLHNKGYKKSGKKFKFFTFSNLQVPLFKVEADRMKVESRQIELILSFYIDQTAENFIINVLKDQMIEIGDFKTKAKFRVIKIEMLPLEIKQETVEVQTLSPLVITKKGEFEGKPADIYLHPQTDEAEFCQYFIDTLISKYLTIKDLYPELPLSPNMTTPAIKILNTERTRRKAIRVKDNAENPIKVIGYENFTFELTAPIPMLEVGFFGGFGQYNGAGMGCCEISK
jgi:CRISPR-associated endoribonuclease Cas6